MNLFRFGRTATFRFDSFFLGFDQVVGEFALKLAVLLLETLEILRFRRKRHIFTDYIILK